MFIFLFVEDIVSAVAVVTLNEEKGESDEKGEMMMINKRTSYL